MTPRLPALDDWRETRDALHAYSRILGAVRRELTERHPQWWNISLSAIDAGLTTGAIPHPGIAGGGLELTLDLARHRLRAAAGQRELASFDLTTGASATDLGTRLLDSLRHAGVETAPKRDRWAESDLHRYDGAAAADYLAALRQARDAFLAARESMPEETGPVQLWPHHFDLSFEWLGAPRPQDDGEDPPPRGQIGFGFSTGDEGHPTAYFYAKPWPFDDDFAAEPPIPQARWVSEGWQGAVLDYAEVREHGIATLREFIDAVWAAAAPALSRPA